MTRITLACSTALGLILSVPAMAQDNAETGNVAEDTQIVVWGTAVLSPDLELGSDDIAIRQADHLSDLLRPLPGVDVGGTHSLNTRINFRGLDDRDLSIYIDGALQTNYLHHHIGNLLINPDILRSADIQLGTNSVTHGGLGGALRFETKDAADLLLDGRSIGGRLSGSWHSNDLLSASATLYGEAGPIDVLAYYSRADRGNFQDGSGRDTIGSDGLTQNAMVKARLNIDDNQSIRISYDRLWDEGDYTQRPDMGAVTNAAITGDILLPTEYVRETINVGYDLDLGDAFSMSLTAYTNDMRLYRDESNPGIPRGIRTDREVTADNWGANLLARTNFELNNLEHGLTYGLEFFSQEFDYVADVTGGAASQIQTSDNFALFLEDEMSFADGRLILRPGIRYNRTEIALETTNQSGSWDEVTWGVAAEVEPIDGITLLASFTTLFRGPELAEPFGGNAGVKVVNPALEPETGNNMELGARYRGSLGAVDLGLSGRFFRTEIQDYIGEVAGPTAGTAMDANLGFAVIDGFEIAANAQMGNVRLFAGYSSADLDASGLNNVNRTESLREIGDKLTGELAWSTADGSLSGSLNAQHTFEQTTIAGPVKPNYTVVNLSVRWDAQNVIPGLSVIAGVDNLFDEAYTSHASRGGSTFHPVFGQLVLDDVEPGRNFKLTAAVRF